MIKYKNSSGIDKKKRKNIRVDCTSKVAKANEYKTKRP
jgi:hypothetical protein